MARYHRQLARMRITVVWREFRRRQSLLQGALGNLQLPPGAGGNLEKNSWEFPGNFRGKRGGPAKGQADKGDP